MVINCEDLQSWNMETACFSSVYYGYIALDYNTDLLYWSYGLSSFYVTVLQHVTKRSFANCEVCVLKTTLSNINMHTWTFNKVRELIAVKLPQISLLNTTVVAFRLLPLGSYAPMPAPRPPFKTILELVLWNGLQSCRFIIPDVINVIKYLHFNISFIFGNRKKSLRATSGEWAGCSNTVICLVAKNSLTDSVLWASARRDARSMSCWQRVRVVSV